jgi:hypothetical protein
MTVELIEQALTHLQAEGAWEQALRAQAHFHDYSFRNAALIAYQCPHATRVAGYHTWQRLGRQVRRGERGIRIVAPIVREDELVGWRCATVFDISQTEGPPLPCEPQLLRGGDLGANALLEEVARRMGIAVTEEALPPGINGLYHRLSSRISLARDLPPRHRAKTLAHELGHVVLHTDAALPRPIVELEAESVAFVVCHTLGIDSSDYTFGYLLHWSGGSQKALDALAASGERIRCAARELIAHAHTSLTPAVDLQGPEATKLATLSGSSALADTPPRAQ